jgi:hypothetical protein
MQERKIQKRLLLVVSFLIFCSFAYFFARKTPGIIAGNDNCVCSYDGFGYYMYLPSLIHSGDLNMQSAWAESLQRQNCDGATMYQLVPRDNGNFIAVYQMGQAYLEAPAFFIGHVFAKTFDYKADGFSPPYHIAFLLNALLFIFLGLFYLKKLLRLFFSIPLTIVLLLIVYVGTNYWITAALSYSLQHIYLFAIIAAMAYYFFKAVLSTQFHYKSIVIAAILFGLTTVIRPTHVLLFLFPLIYLWSYFPTKKQLFGVLALFPLSSFLWNLPQIIYWKMIGGNWLITNLHSEEIVLIEPHLWDFLFSFRKGWLLYTPVFLLLIPGFYSLRKTNKSLYRSLITLLIVVVWVISSWETWWYAASFSQRVMVDYYPLLLLPIGFFLQNLTRKKSMMWGVGSFLFIGHSLNVIQSIQFVQGYLHEGRMSKAHYSYIFGQISIPAYDDYRLLIDRSSFIWEERIRKAHYSDQHLQKSVFFQSYKPLDVLQNSDASIATIPYFERLNTDESLFDVELVTTTSDTTQSCLLKLESISKYNCYSWHQIELSQGLRKGKNTIRFRYNLPDIRHQADKVQIYIHNPSSAKVRLSSLKISATSLIRK